MGAVNLDNKRRLYWDGKREQQQQHSFSIGEFYHEFLFLMMGLTWKLTSQDIQQVLIESNFNHFIEPLGEIFDRTAAHFGV